MVQGCGKGLPGRELVAWAPDPGSGPWHSTSEQVSGKVAFWMLLYLLRLGTTLATLDSPFFHDRHRIDLALQAFVREFSRILRIVALLGTAVGTKILVTTQKMSFFHSSSNYV